MNNGNQAKNLKILNSMKNYLKTSLIVSCFEKDPKWMKNDHILIYIIIANHHSGAKENTKYLRIFSRYFEGITLNILYNFYDTYCSFL